VLANVGLILDAEDKVYEKQHAGKNDADLWGVGVVTD